MPSNQVGPTNNSLKQLRLVLKVAAKNWLLLLLLPGMAYGYGRFVTHQQLDQHGAQAELLLEEKDEYDKAREVVEGVISRRFQRQGPDIANQVRILKSRDLVARAVGDLDHNITHFIVGRVRALPVGGLSGVEVEAWPEHFSNNALGVDFDLSLDSDATASELVRNGQIYDGEHKFYDVVQTGDFKLSIRRAGDGRGSIEQAIAQGQRFQVRNDEDIIRQYRNRLSVNGVGQTSILKLQINDIRPERAIEFLDALSNRYIEYSTAARKEVNRKTDEFIETQLIQIEANIDSLQGIIDEQREKAGNLNLTRNEQAYFQELVQLESQQEELKLNLRSLGALENYLRRGVENTSIPPSAFLSSDPVAADKVGELYDSASANPNARRDAEQLPNQAARLAHLHNADLFDYIGSARRAWRKKMI